MLFDELSRSNGAEGRAREIEISVCGDGHNGFVKILYAFAFAKFLFLFFFGFKQVFGVFAPCAIVIFVENDAIPLGRVNPFVFCLNAACASVLAKIVLKRTKADKRLLCIGVFVRQAIG